MSNMGPTKKRWTQVLAKEKEFLFLMNIYVFPHQIFWMGIQITCLFSWIAFSLLIDMLKIEGMQKSRNNKFQFAVLNSCVMFYVEILNKPWPTTQIDDVALCFKLKINFMNLYMNLSWVDCYENITYQW
jgi:hypothetical protein